MLFIESNPNHLQRDGAALGLTLSFGAVLGVTLNKFGKSFSKNSTSLTKGTFEKLAFDPGKGKITSASIEELRAGLAAERAGLIDKIKFRGDPNFPNIEPGFEFTTKSGLQLDVKAFRENSLLKPRELQKFKNKFVDNDVKILVDSRNLNSSQLKVIIDRAESVGITKDRFLIPDQKFFSKIEVDGELF